MGDDAERLTQLAKLHADGALTDDEFAAAKRRILDPSDPAEEAPSAEPDERVDPPQPPVWRRPKSLAVAAAGLAVVVMIVYSNRDHQYAGLPYVLESSNCVSITQETIDFFNRGLDPVELGVRADTREYAIAADHYQQAALMEQREGPQETLGWVQTMAGDYCHD